MHLATVYTIGHFNPYTLTLYTTEIGICISAGVDDQCFFSLHLKPGSIFKNLIRVFMVGRKILIWLYILNQYCQAVQRLVLGDYFGQERKSKHT